MKNWVKYFLLFISSGIFAQGEVCIKPDSVHTASTHNEIHFLPDDPFLEMLDSLYEADIFSANAMCYNTNELNIHEFPLDSIPIYSDSILALRFQDLAAISPIAFTYNDRVKRLFNIYSVHRRLMLSRVMGLSELYFPMIEEELEKNDLPLELKYLPIVESALNNTVRSRAGAVGMWQFMYRTGKYLGLKINSYVDERRDPVKATKTAVKYLKYLHGIYDDWLLALAAYNAGPGNVNKAIRRSGGKRNFWAIQYALPRETRNYVPSFMAVVYLMSHSADHNLYPIKPNFSVRHFDTITVKKAIHFQQIANVLCVPYSELTFLNPQYKSGFVPIKPSDTTKYTITLPVAMIGDFVTNENIIYNYKLKDEDQQEVEIYANRDEITHRVRKGESVGLIAQRYNVRVSDLREWNNLSRSSYIYPGQKLIIFAKEGNNGSSGYGKTPDENYKGFVYYTIRRGDTLWDIAKKYQGVSAKDIMELNKISARKVLKPGMKIKIKST